MEVDAEVKHPMLTADSKGLLLLANPKSCAQHGRQVMLISYPHLTQFYNCRLG